MKKHLTPLRYPGGKSKLYLFITKLIENNFSFKPVYVEAFAGGAGLAFQLLFNEKVSEIYLNDLDENIYAFWASVLYETNALISLIEKTEVNLETWRQQKAIYKDNSCNKTTLQKGFATFFLNRTNRSGILSAGPMGGYEQKGNYKIDSRFNKTPLIALIRQIASFKDKIFLSNLDAKEFIASVDAQKDNLLFYLDPPYFLKGANLYPHFFKEQNHIELFEVLNKLRNKWLLTYDDHEFIHSLYHDYNPSFFDLNYSVQTKRVAQEILIFSHNFIKKF